MHAFVLHFLPLLPRAILGMIFSSVVFLLRLSIRDKFLLHFGLFLISKHNCIQQPTLTIAVLLKVWNVEMYLVNLTFLHISTVVQCLRLCLPKQGVWV